MSDRNVADFAREKILAFLDAEGSELSHAAKTAIEGLQAQLASTQAELEKARSVLRRLEFDCEDGSGWCCPICNASLRLHSSKPRRVQHNPNCELANALNRGETE